MFRELIATRTRFLVFPPSTEPGPEESPEARPQRPISAGLDRWVVIIRQHFGTWFELITFSAYRYMATKNGVYNKSRGDKQTQFDPRPVRAVFLSF